MVRVNIQEAKTHLSRYVDQVEKGDVVVGCLYGNALDVMPLTGK